MSDIALNALENAKSRREAARHSPRVTPEEFFARVAELAGQDSAACRRLANLGDLIPAVTKRDQAFILRAKGAGERAIGSWQSAADAFLAAGDLLKGKDRWVFSLGAIDSLARAGRLIQGVEYGRRAINGLRKDKPLAARARLNVANALVWADRYREALSEYERAARDLPAEAIFEQAIAHLGASTAGLLVADVQPARQKAEEALRLFEQIGMHHHANLARINIAQANFHLGYADDAVMLLLEIAPKMQDSPPERARIQEFLGDCYVRLNLKEEAESAYRAALAIPAIRSMPLNQANCLYGLAALADDRKLFRRAAKSYARAQNRPWELAAVGRADPKQSSGAIAELRGMKARFLEEDLAIWAAERQGRAIPKSTSYAAHQWRLAWLQARREPTAQSYRKVFDLILRDREAIRTPSAALRFFDDRGQAVNEYLDLLLAEEKIDEAVDVVTRSRSVALIDEILAARRETLPSEVVRHLDALQLELSDNSYPGSRLRLSAARPSSRAWVESSWRKARIEPRVERSQKPTGDIWIDTGHLHHIAGARARKLGLNQQELSRQLDWLEFALFEPMVSPANPEGAETQIAELKSLIGVPGDAVCPDGVLWRVPWTLLSDREIVLLLNPADPIPCLDLEKPKVAIWVAESPDLPHLAEEVRQIQAIYPTAQILNSRAQIRDQKPQEYDLIHVAGHARINRSAPGFSYIDFPDGPLFAAEIARSGTRTRLAVVAACQSGVSTCHQTYEPEGLVRAFLACGAQAAIGSLWPLDDEFTPHFMRALYLKLSQGHSLIEAMAHARHHGRARFPHPYYWGALALFGGYES